MQVAESMSIGRFGDRRAALLEAMLYTRSVCERQMAKGVWRDQMRFWRFIANERVTVEKLIEGWCEQTQSAVRGRHVLAIQDTSEIKFYDRRRPARTW